MMFFHEMAELMDNDRIDEVLLSAEKCRESIAKVQAIFGAAAAPSRLGGSNFDAGI